MARESHAQQTVREEQPAETTAVKTPQGTWAILLGYAVILTGLWVYGYIELLVRR